MRIPAWSISFTKKQYPSMAIGAWLLLREQIGDGNKCLRSEAVRFLAGRFCFSEAWCRRILDRGSGIFWSYEQNDRHVRLREDYKLWTLTDRSIPMQREIDIPIEVFQSRSQLYSHLSIPALTRGDRPCSLAYSAKMLGRSYNTAKRRRRYLRRQGILTVEKNYSEVRKHRRWRLTDKFKPNQFVKGEWLVERLPDTILLIGENGEPIDLLVNPEANIKKIFPKRYFTTQEELLCWERDGKPLFRNPTVRGDPWKFYKTKLNGLDRFLPRKDRRSYLENTPGRKVSLSEDKVYEKELGGSLPPHNGKPYYRDA